MGGVRAKGGPCVNDNVSARGIPCTRSDPDTTFLCALCSTPSRQHPVGSGGGAVRGHDCVVMTESCGWVCLMSARIICTRESVEKRIGWTEKREGSNVKQLSAVPIIAKDNA
jgi:hypothetical protein